MQTYILRAVLGLVIVLSSSAAGAANHYVRKGATGAGTGADWTNAYTSWPGTWTRGDTYYVADGAYGSFTFSLPTGTSMITVKKATVADHGVDTGWDVTYGDGVASFGPLSVANNGNFTLDGYSEVAPKNRGFAVTFGAGQYGFKYDSDVPNITIQYMDIGGPNTSITNCAIGVWASGNFSAKSGLTVRRNAIHGTDTLVQLHTISNVVIEYNDLYDTYSTSSCHANVVLTQVATASTFRYNRIYNWQVEGFFITFPGTTFSSSQNQSWDIYGNVFFSPALNSSTRAIETHQDGSGWGPINVYNNTFVGLDFVAMNMAGGLSSKSAAYNNVFYNCSNGTGLSDFPTHDYNWLRSSGSTSEAHVQNATTNPFLDLANRDFRLNGATNPALPLASPYNMDILGTPRGGDGTWDRGAYEWCSSGACAAPAPPQNLRIVTE